MQYTRKSSTYSDGDAGGVEDKNLNIPKGKGIKDDNERSYKVRD